MSPSSLNNKIVHCRRRLPGNGGQINKQFLQTSLSCRHFLAPLSRWSAHAGSSDSLWSLGFLCSAELHIIQLFLFNTYLWLAPLMSADSRNSEPVGLHCAAVQRQRVGCSSEVLIKALPYSQIAGLTRRRSVSTPAEERWKKKSRMITKHVGARWLFFYFQETIFVQCNKTAVQIPSAQPLKPLLKAGIQSLLFIKPNAEAAARLHGINQSSPARWRSFEQSLPLSRLTCTVPTKFPRILRAHIPALF